MGALRGFKETHVFLRVSDNGPNLLSIGLVSIGGSFRAIVFAVSVRLNVYSVLLHFDKGPNIGCSPSSSASVFCIM